MLLQSTEVDKNSACVIQESNILDTFHEESFCLYFGEIKLSLKEQKIIFTASFSIEYFLKYLLYISYNMKYK